MVDMNDRLRSLGEMVREQTERGPATDHTLHSVRNRLRVAAYAPHKRASVLAYSTFTAGLVAVALALVVFYKNGSQRPLSVTLESQEPHLVGRWVETQDETKQLRFSDGTSLGLGPETAVNVRETTQTGGTIVLGQGRARAQIVHVKDARWTFMAGPFSVRVTGTEFDLGWDPASETLELALHQGSVELTGPTLAQPRKVRKGEFVRLRLQKDEVPRLVPSASEPSAQGTDSNETGEKQSVEAPAQLAREDQDLARASVQDLWELSQNARLSGKPALARDALLALRAHHGTRGQTAFLLGKIHADQLQNHREAIRWFQTYLKEAPGGSLSEQTWGRLIELQAGSEAGRKAARSYLERYPNGSYKTLAERSLR